MSVLSELEKKLGILPLSFAIKENIKQVDEDIQAEAEKQDVKQSKNVSKKLLNEMTAEELQEKLKQCCFDLTKYTSKWRCSISIARSILTYLRQIDLNKLNENELENYKTLSLGILKNNIEYKEFKEMLQVLYVKGS